ncbi:MAG: hypothetical protein NDJ19_08835 [Ramlibacter sp.]|nr:hypothetical protein [Ramlibacter sp.]
MPARNLPPDNEEVLELSGRIYASAAEPQQLAEALRLFNEAVGGACAQIFTLHGGRPVRSQFSGTVEFPEELNRQYLSRWGALDPRAAAAATLPAGEVFRCHERFDDAFVGSNSFYQDYLISHGLRWSIAGVIDSSADTATVLAAARAPQAPRFEDWTAALLRKLLPHFRAAAALRDRLQDPRPGPNPAMEMLRALPIPCLFTDHAGRCIERNEAFDRAAQLFSIRLLVGRVRFADPQLHQMWETGLAETHATAVGQSFPAQGGDGRPWRVHLVPLHSVIQSNNNLDNKMILVVFERKEQDLQPAMESLTSGAHLTAAELDVAAGLLQGLPAKVIARQRGASVHTVRSQIMAILEKTGHRSQRELMAAFGASAFGASSQFASALRPVSMAPDAAQSGPVGPAHRRDG